MIAEARRNSPSFDDIEDANMEASLDEIMIRIASICGCALPNTEFFARYIADEIKKFIISFGYSEYTLEEIILAFRINSASEDFIHFTGVCLNVDYISKVLNSYSVIRKILENKLKNKIDGYEL